MRRGCRKIIWFAGAVGSSGSIGWAPLARVGQVDSSLQDRSAAGGAKYGTRLFEEILTGISFDPYALGSR